MQYINKSLNEIENPTQIDYVSVVDRTEEYDPSEYLSRPSDDDSDKIIQMEEETKYSESNEDVIDVFENDAVPNDVITPMKDEEIKLGYFRNWLDCN